MPTILKRGPADHGRPLRWEEYEQPTSIWNCVSTTIREFWILNGRQHTEWPTQDFRRRHGSCSMLFEVRRGSRTRHGSFPAFRCSLTPAASFSQ
jgi:hypothetical protein